MTRKDRMCRALRRLTFLTLSFIVSLSGLSLAADLAIPAGLAALSQPSSLPVFELPDAQGSTVNSADLQGKVVVVRFWATW